LGAEIENKNFGVHEQSYKSLAISTIPA